MRLANLRAMTVKITVFWFVCTNVFHIRNFGTCLPEEKASQPQCMEYSLQAVTAVRDRNVHLL